MPIRITGMNSGLDTESLITELVSAQSAKKNSLVKAQTKLSWKTEAWKTLNSKIYSLYTGSISNMRFSSAYTKKKSTVSNSAVASVIAGADAVNGTQTLKVNSLAKSGYLTGEALKDGNGDKASYTKATKLTDIAGLNLSEGDSLSFSIKTKGKTTNIDLTGASTINDVVSKLKEAGVNASFDENYQRFFISATETGNDADFSLTANDSNGFKALSALGINVMDAATQKEYTSLANMTDDQKAAYIEKETQARAEALNNSIDAANKTIEDKQKQFDSFFAEITDPYYVKADLDTTDKIATAKEQMTTLRDSLKEPVDGETETEKTEREAKLKEAEDRLTNLQKIEGYLTDIEKANSTITDANDQLANDNAKIKEKVTAELDSKIAQATAALAGGGFSTGATRIQGQDAVIELNGATFESKSNTFEINGFTINATAESSETVTITTNNDYDGIYDTIKGFIKGYNELINEMDKLYNAESSKGYEPLLTEEKDAMSDKEIEEWEKKIKDSLLRRDSTLNTVAKAMQSAMAKGFDINGQTMYLSNFGINTLSYFTAQENEKHAYHIDGDPDDSSTKSNADKLKTMISNDPDTVMKFFQELSNELYKTLTDKMAASSMSSIYTAYNDKEMKSQYDDYASKISREEQRLTDMQDKWYDKFGKMETALAKLSSKTSALSGLLGM